MTGLDRATFCNTGSEAVMAAMRAARTVTGRDKIVYFSGDYHGIFDEVLARAGTVDGQPGALPVAPGIPPLPNMIVLEYNLPASLEVIRQRADEIAAVIVEPVQSRHPDLQPKEFLHALRQLTTDKDIALIFDEVVTGFRLAPGGAQEYFGVRADSGHLRQSRWRRHAHRGAGGNPPVYGCVGRRNMAVWRRFFSRSGRDFLRRHFRPSSAGHGGRARHPETSPAGRT